jgi:hypothetical protein
VTRGTSFYRDDSKSFAMIPIVGQSFSGGFVRCLCYFRRHDLADAEVSIFFFGRRDYIEECRSGTIDSGHS